MPDFKGPWIEMTNDDGETLAIGRNRTGTGYTIEIDSHPLTSFEMTADEYAQLLRSMGALG